MNDPVQPCPDCLHPQENHPIVSEAGRDQKVCEPIGDRDVRFVDMETLAFMVPEECLDLETFGVDPTGFLRRLEVGDQMDGLLAVLSPPSDGVDRSVFFVSEQDSGGKEVFPPLAMRDHGVKAKRFTLPVEYGALCRAANIGPLPVADNRLEIDSIKLTITNQGNFCPFRYQLPHFLHQLDMYRLGQVSLFVSHNGPGYGKKLLAIHNPNVESHTATPHDRAIHYKNQRLLGKRHQQSTGYGKKVSPKMVGSVIEPSRKALFSTCRSCFRTNLPGDFWQLCAAASHDCTDKGCKGGKMLGLTASHVGHEFLQCGQNRSKGFL